MNHSSYATENVILRRATLDDATAIFNWRNSPVIRENSFSSREITWDEHYPWFKNCLERNDRILLIGEIKASPIGVLRYDIFNNVAEVNIYLVPGLQGQGLGTKLLCAGNDWLKSNFRNIEKIVGYILPDNLASQKAFVKSGFEEKRRVFQYSVKSSAVQE